MKNLLLLIGLIFLLGCGRGKEQTMTIVETKTTITPVEPEVVEMDVIEESIAPEKTATSDFKALQREISSLEEEVSLRDEKIKELSEELARSKKYLSIVSDDYENTIAELEKDKRVIAEGCLGDLLKGEITKLKNRILDLVTENSLLKDNVVVSTPAGPTVNPLDRWPIRRNSIYLGYLYDGKDSLFGAQYGRSFTNFLGVSGGLYIDSDLKKFYPAGNIKISW